MNKTTHTYDSALSRLNAITEQLEGQTALSMAEYKALAKEGAELLAFCRKELTLFADQLQKEEAR